MMNWIIKERRKKEEETYDVCPDLCHEYYPSISHVFRAQQSLNDIIVHSLLSQIIYQSNVVQES
jgi:hypothetical protein